MDIQIIRGIFQESPGKQHPQTKEEPTTLTVGHCCKLPAQVCFVYDTLDPIAPISTRLISEILRII